MHGDTGLRRLGRGASSGIGPARRPLLTLWAAAVIGGGSQSLAGAAGALLAHQVHGAVAVAGLPQAALVTGAALAALAASRLARSCGRGAALSASAAAAAAGCLVVAAGAVLADLALILAGNLLVGAGTATVMLGRYAAADLAAADRRVRAMASVLTATAFGAVLGPNLLAPSARGAVGLDLPALSGPFLVAAAGFVSTAVVLASGLRDRSAMTVRRAPDASAAPAGEERSSATGMAVLVLANLVMVAVMTMAPVHLDHLGAGLAPIGFIISVHIAGMFAVAPLSARITDRVGARSAAVVAGTAMAAACGAAAMGAGSVIAMGAAMALLGAGWNLALVSGSVLLTVGLPADRRLRQEGRGEAGMGLAAAVGSVVCGPVAAVGGYAALAIGGAFVAAAVGPIVGNRSVRRSRGPVR